MFSRFHVELRLARAVYLQYGDVYPGSWTTPFHWQCQSMYRRPCEEVAVAGCSPPHELLRRLELTHTPVTAGLPRFCPWGSCRWVMHPSEPVWVPHGRVRGGQERSFNQLLLGTEPPLAHGLGRPFRISIGLISLSWGLFAIDTLVDQCQFKHPDRPNLCPARNS